MLDNGMTAMKPGSMKSIQCVVASVDATLTYLTEQGVEASGVDEQPWGRFVRFRDPDGNSWSLQELVPQRGRTRRAGCGRETSLGRPISRAGRCQPRCASRQASHLLTGARS
jgi:catechol 2,3-dioxygenase-like lactoylglutathione lyase family enzyme